ncbi:hypothetical protein [Synechococcus sp. WH 8101]|uniref:hypothetical protein n=1 Tax=Synechococcus sp. WH 8101 TaxID=59932 RepID=UPI0026840471
MRAVQMLPRTGMLLGLALTGLTVAVEAARAQSPMGGYQTPQEREIYNTVPGQNDSTSPLDATNPMDLINRLRRATSMSDATDPSDAIDAALKGYQTEAPAQPGPLPQP